MSPPTVLPLGQYLTSRADPALACTPYAALANYDLAAWLTAWPELHARALTSLTHRIHPSARIHPTAVTGDDVSTVRGHTLLAPSVSVGFNCEVTKSYLGTGTVLGHRISLNRTLVGDHTHLSAEVTVQAIHLTAHMARPDRDTLLRLPTGLYRCRTPASAPSSATVSRPAAASPSQRDVPSAAPASSTPTS